MTMMTRTTITVATITMTTITVATITMMWCRYGTHSPSPRNLHERPTRTSLSKEKIAKKAKVHSRYSRLSALALQSPIDLLFAGSQNEGSDTGRHKDTAAAPPRRRPSASPSQSGVVGASSLTLCSPL